MKQLLFIALWLMVGVALAQNAGLPCPGFEIQTEYDSTHRRYHYYQVETPLCALDEARGLTPQAVFALLCSDLTLVAPLSPAYRGPVRPCERLEVKIAFTRRNPIVTAVDRAALRLVNYSLPGHFLHPGMVERQVVVREGQVWMVTRSWGEGRLPRANERKAEDTWGGIDAQLKTRLLEEAAE